MNLDPKSSGKPETKFEKFHINLQDLQWIILVGEQGEPVIFDKKN